MASDTSTEVPIAALGERLGALRLCEASALDAMRRSLVRHGQLTPVVGFSTGNAFELIDGFKRLRAARALEWRTLRAEILSVDLVEAKLMLPSLHEARGLTELEEGWLVRSLYREDRLTQTAIAQRLGRHKSWVHRRLLLVEALDGAVQADVRLGLLVPRAAVALGPLPRGNQHAVAGVVIRRGLTVRQTERLVADLLECRGEAARAERLARYGEGRLPGPRPGVRPARSGRSEAEQLTGDITAMLRLSARVQARLLAMPLAAHGPEAAELVGAALRELEPALGALSRSITQALTRRACA